MTFSGLINLCILPIANYVAKCWMYITLQGLFFTTIPIFEVTYLRRRKRISKCPGLRKIWSVCANVMFTTDGGLPQAQVCDICHRYGRRKIIKRWHFQLWNWQIFATFCVRRTFQQQNYMLHHQLWFQTKTVNKIWIYPVKDVQKSSFKTKVQG